MTDDSDFRTVPEVVEAGDGGSDDMSDSEAQQLSKNKSADDLRKEAEKSEFKRNEGFKQHFGIITVVALYAMALGVLLFGFTWAWHILAPHCMHWLEPDELGRIQSIVTGGVLAGLIADQFRKRMQ